MYHNIVIIAFHLHHIPILITVFHSEVWGGGGGRFV